MQRRAEFTGHVVVGADLDSFVATPLNREREGRSVTVMETWDAITARRNVRTYTNRPIDDADMDRILEAGRRSPSASNRQKWDFVLVTDRGPAGRGWAPSGRVHATCPARQRPSCWILPEPETERYRLIDQYDLGQATMAMMLAATDSASAAPIPRSVTSTPLAACSVCRTTVTPPTCSLSATPPTAR